MKYFLLTLALLTELFAFYQLTLPDNLLNIDINRFNNDVKELQRSK